MKVIFILATITLVVLFIACINFINLTIAHSIKRMKEMGIRKVAGATRRDILLQSLSETLLIALIALFFALILVETFHSAMPLFTGNIHILEKLNFFQTSIWTILGVLTFMLLVVVFIAGFYPAFYLSKVPVIKVLKGHLALTKGKPLLRQLLIMVQFVISATLILCTLIIATQVDFLIRKDLGYNPSDKLVIPLMSELSSTACEVLRSGFLTVPGVTGAGASTQIPGNGFTSNGYLPEGFQEPLMINVVDVDYDYLTVMGLEPVEGRNFMKESGTDRDAIIINRSLAERLQWNDPLEKTIKRDGDHKIIGVVNDFHFSSLHNDIEPLIITLKPWKGYNYITLSINGKINQQLIQQLENKWKAVAPHEDFQYMSLSDYIKEGYQMEMSFISVLTVCAIIALLIATIGLFGLAAFVTRARYREMAIRKIYGASESRIHILLSRDFLIWVFIANIIAIPFAWFFMNQWLQQFAFHQGIRWWIFFATIAFCLLLASAVVFFQGLRINRLNPVDIIRYE
jgi:putative ABC transport system permease protein